MFDDVGSKYVPPHVNIFYCFGGLVFTSFIAQVTTGAAMTFYYVPEVSRSLSSVAYITYEARNGWALRSMHRWIASFMVLAASGLRTYEWILASLAGILNLGLALAIASGVISSSTLERR